MEVVYVIHPFIAENEDEISLNVGDPVVVVERDDDFNDGWWQGRNVQGDEGLFPVNYTSAEQDDEFDTLTQGDETEDAEDGEIIDEDALSEDQGYTDEYDESDGRSSCLSSSKLSRASSISQPVSTPSASTMTYPKDVGSMYSVVSSRQDNEPVMPPILSPNITFASKNLQKAVRATLLSTTLSPTPPEQWDAQQVADWLHQMGFDTVVQQFVDQEITGDILLELSLQSLKEFDISTFGKRFKIHSAILALREEILRQDPFYLVPSKSCLSTTEDYHWMITGEGQPPNKYSYLRHPSSFDDERSEDDSLSNGFKQGVPEDLMHPSLENGKPHGILRVLPYSDNSHLMESVDDHVTPDMEGWLYKQGDKYKTWNKRWFVLKGFNLFYFKSPKDVRMKGIINLRGYRIICDETIAVGHYSFKAQHDRERTFFFYADTDLSMKAWVQALIKATISRDFTSPVVSSSTIPTVPLDIAKRMNPRPPSTLLYINKKDQMPCVTMSSPPQLISSITEDTILPVLPAVIQES
ncbi:hypothetical protein BC940DRAFT_306959 [Gongronella butleri]|nr:hypothetical protein BC940DRAFT_306959 [Gongronella butleri]